MKFTNHTFLPQPIFDAVTNDPYDKGEADYSVTGLMTPPRISALMEKHGHEIIEDASSRIWSLLGQSIHTILERAERTALAEKRLYTTIDGVRISGKFDRFVLEDGVLQDYKVTSVYKAMRPISEDFIAQQNAYLLLLLRNGYTAKSTQLVYILRDWHRPTARRDRGVYPPYGIVIQDVPVWSEEKTVEFLRLRIHLQKSARGASLPLCTREERWQNEDTYAAKKPDAKKAYRLFGHLSDAVAFQANNPDYDITLRRGEPKRCLDYCPVSSFCSQFTIDYSHENTPSSPVPSLPASSES